MVRIYHNPRCRKSRETLEIIRQAGYEPEIVEYLQNPPSKNELKDMLEKMGKSPEQIIRKGEDIFKSNFKGRTLSDEEWIEVLVNHPNLLERPIVVHDEKVALGRPPENVRSIL
jgi:arsenate reductase